MTYQPQPEVLAVADSYGLDEPGADAASLGTICERFAAERNWWVVSVRHDGRPHTVPVWGIVIDQRLYFCSDAAARKTAHLIANQSCVVHLESGDHVAIAEGDAELVPRSDIPEPFATTYAAKYGIELDLEADGVAYFTINPAKVMAWEEADFANTAVRYRF